MRQFRSQMVALASDGIYITVILISCQSSSEHTREIVEGESCGFAEVVVGSLRGEISNFPLCLYCFCLKGQKRHTVLPWAESVTSLPGTCAERVFHSCCKCWQRWSPDSRLSSSKTERGVGSGGDPCAGGANRVPPPVFAPHPLPQALLNQRGLFFSNVLLNEESNNPHFNYTQAPFIIPRDLFK